MLSMITGKQRSGKTYYCVTLFIDYLRHYQKRPLYSNLPLNPDFLCRLASRKNVVNFQDYLSRVHLFMKFRRLSEAKAFHKKNPCFIALNKVSRAIKNEYKIDGKYIFSLSDSDYYYRSDRHILPQECIRKYWRFTKTNCVTFLDEVYQWFHNSSAYNRDEQSINDRKELLTYTRQHGHSKDDLYLISHDLSDVDVSIRKGVQYLYIIRNSKYTNVFEWKWMRGLKWPWQFFIIEGYEFGEVVPSDSWKLGTVSAYFKCYNSFSCAETLVKNSASSADEQSTDTGVNFWWNFKRFAAQAWVGGALLAGLVVGGCVAYDKITNNLNFKTTTETKSKTSLAASPVVNSAVVPAVPSSSRVQIISITPNCLNWADGFKLKKGQDYEGFKVHEVTRDSVVFFHPSSKKLFRVSHAGSRNYQNDPPRSGVSPVATSGDFKPSPPVSVPVSVPVSSSVASSGVASSINRQQSQVKSYKY